jgi:hypothetical protein
MTTRIAFALVLAAAPALAQAPAQNAPDPAMRRACMQDVRRLCPGIRPGDGRLAQCMESKNDQLSSACRQAIEAARARQSRSQSR